MALSLPDLIAARESLFMARAGGVRRFRDQNGEEVEYRSDAEMGRALAALNSAIAAAGKPLTSTILFRTSKGI